MLDQLRSIAKALTGFITPGVAVLIFATSEASHRAETITTSEWLLALGACLGTGAAVYTVPNKDKPKPNRRRARPKTSA